MKKKLEVSKREKSAAVGLVVCFVGMIAIVGMITFSQYKRNMQLQLAEAEEKKVELEKAQVTTTDTVKSEIEKPIQEEITEVEIVPAAPTLEFTGSDVLAWPMEGNVILSYSMDKTVYFSTLDQYKYNPAMLISGEVGADVIASAEGEVTAIEVDAQTGTTITMNLGSGYELVYGQVKEVCVQKGDRVAKGERIGYLSEPTKYYSVEGPNLYFKLMKNGEPVDPMEYMEA